MLEDKIAAVAAQMKAKLAETRATFSHPGDKGDHVEAALRAFLQQYLPRRLSVGHGEVIDKAGKRSGQTDIIVANEDHPFTFTPDAPGLFFVEGVCGGGEAKSLLTSQELSATIANARKWKELTIKPGGGVLVHATPTDLARFYKKPPYFLVAMESELSLPTVHQRLQTEGHFGDTGNTQMLDAVFLLDRGWAIDFGTGAGTFQFQRPDGSSAAGWQWQQTDQVLFQLLSWLSASMPKMIQFEPVLLSYLVRNIETATPG